MFINNFWDAFLQTGCWVYSDSRVHLFWMNSLGEYDDKAEQEGKKAYRSFLEKYPFVRLIQTDHPNLWREVLSGS